MVREPSAEVLRLAAGTRVEGTVLPPPPPQVEAARAAVQTLQTAADANRADSKTEIVRATIEQQAPRSSSPAAAQPQTQASHVQVRTAVGDITLRTPLPLPEGARVTLDVASNNGGQVTVRFTALNGQPVQQALVQLAADRAAVPAQSALPSAAGPTAPSGALTLGQAWTPSGPVALTQAGSLNAFVLAGSAPSVSAPLVPGQTAALSNVQTPPLQPGLITGADLTGVTPGQPGGAPGVPATGAVGTQAAPLVSSGGTPALTAATSPAATATTTLQTPGTPQAAAGPSAPQSSPQGPAALLPSGGGAQTGLRLVGGQGWPPPPFATPSQGQPAPV